MLRIWLRAWLAVVLACAALSPAVAEIGCNSDRLAEATAGSPLSIGGDLPAPVDQDEGAAKAGHCSFSHCAQSVQPSKTSISALPLAKPAAVYPAFGDVTPTSNSRDGPERPPQA
jgi:hypothetical protein